MAKVLARRRRVARRVAFSPYACAVLTTAFTISPTPSKDQRERLAEAIGTTERRVQVWFQNRRQRANSSGSAIETLRTDEPCTSSDVADGDDSEDPESEGEEEGVDAYPIDQCTSIAPVPTAVPYDESRVKEGCPKDDMRMEAFTTLFPPFEVMWASDDWLSFCGFQDSEIVGKTLKIIQGMETDVDTVSALMDAVSRTDSINVRLTNYTKHGLPFSHDLKVEPLTNSRGEPVLYRVRSSNVAPLLHQGLIVHGEDARTHATNQPPSAAVTTM